MHIPGVVDITEGWMIKPRITDLEESAKYGTQGIPILLQVAKEYLGENPINES